MLTEKELNTVLAALRFFKKLTHLLQKAHVKPHGWESLY